MASLRISVVNEARRLAAAAGDPTAGDSGYEVPAEVVERLHSRLRGADEPARILQWAWRSQRARFDETGWHRDGLAALYLLAALIDLQTDQTSEPVWSIAGASALGSLRTMAGSSRRT